MMLPDGATSDADRRNGRPRQAARAEESAVESVESAADRLRSSARNAIGVTGHADARSLRNTFTHSGVGPYTAIALGLLVAVDQMQGAALGILGPEITSTLGIPRGSYALIVLLKGLVVSIASLPLAAIVQRRAKRAAVSITTAFAWAALTAMSAFVISIWGLFAVVITAGAATASVRSVHQPLLMDSYPPDTRVRILSFYRAFDSVGDIATSLLIGLAVVVLGLTWRGVFVMMGAVCIGAAIAAVGLRDPGFGRWDTEKVREVARRDTGSTTTDQNVSLGFFEIASRLMLIPTVRRMLASSAVLGMLLAPFITYLAFFLQERWGMGPGARSVFAVIMPLFGLVALRVFGPAGEQLFRRDPARLVRVAAALMAINVCSIALAVFSPWFGGMVLFFGAAHAASAVLVPAKVMVTLSIVPAHMRAHLSALLGIFTFGVGGIAGVVLLGGIDRRFGITGAMLSLAIPGLVAALVLRSAATTINSDLDRMLDEVIEEEEVHGVIASGVRLPMLACRHIDFSYGQLQVLFGVNFTVDEGEMVALLGTNGAGKSTLLRVISGLGLPSRGTVRFEGGDITYVGAERRVGLGISQIPGGKAVFGGMSVVDNLRALAYTHGRNRKAISNGIEASFDAFPRLDERRNQLAATLSGGEQQMLGLATAFIVRPRLLLIDELSLGLAPKVVGELLDMVRAINARGTAIVLVEQSVNVALSVVNHAYFMEKGEIRFDGEASELLARPDLLRSVFLEGASKGLASAGEDDYG